MLAAEIVPLQMTPDLTNEQTIGLATAIVGATLLCLVTAATVLTYAEAIRTFLQQHGLLITPPPVNPPLHILRPETIELPPYTPCTRRMARGRPQRLLPALEIRTIQIEEPIGNS